MEDCRVRQAQPDLSRSGQLPLRTDFDQAFDLHLVNGVVSSAAHGNICRDWTRPVRPRLRRLYQEPANRISNRGWRGFTGGLDCGTVVLRQGTAPGHTGFHRKGRPSSAMTSGSGLVSVVFSFRNEAENIPTLVSRVDAAFSGQPERYEIIFVNDRSSDNSLEILMKERERNPAVKILNMSRRFGVGECVRAGMQWSKGDAVIYMDADLQDPPELIPKLLEFWRQGAQVVHTQRTRRTGESPAKMWLTKQAYRVIRFEIG